MATAKTLEMKPCLRNPRRPSRTAGRRPTDLVVLAINDLGLIRDCSEACEQVFGYLPSELVGCHVSTLLPQLAETELVQDGRIDARVAYLCHCGFVFQAQHRDGLHFAIELFINRLDHHNVAVLVRSLEAPVGNVATGQIQEAGAFRPSNRRVSGDHR